MIALLVFFALPVSGETTGDRARLSADFDGGGAELTAVAEVRGGKIRLEVRDAQGRVLATASPPSPGKNASVALSGGSLGSAGTLIEVSAIAQGSECRSVWRYREGRAMRVPLATESSPPSDCGPTDWSYRWEKLPGDATAVYVRERTRQRANGTLRQLDAFRYVGFRLALDPERSSSWINGVEIPSWRPVVLYSIPALESLQARFDLSGIRTRPSLRIVTDRAEGLFQVSAGDGTRAETLVVTAAAKTESPRERILTAGAAGARLRVTLSADFSTPMEASLQGLEKEFDQAYFAASRMRGSAIRVYDTAEQELAEEYLPGHWDAGEEQIAIKLISSSPPAVRVGSDDFLVKIAEAPSGMDALLLPRKGSGTSAGLLLRGPNLFTETLMRCRTGPSPGAPACETLRPGRTLRRVGARLNER